MAAKKMKGNADKNKNEIMELVDEATAPDVMSAEEALEYVEDVIGDLQARADGLKDDIRNAGG